MYPFPILVGGGGLELSNGRCYEVYIFRYHLPDNAAKLSPETSVAGIFKLRSRFPQTSSSLSQDYTSKQGFLKATEFHEILQHFSMFENAQYGIRMGIYHQCCSYFCAVLNRRFAQKLQTVILLNILIFGKADFSSTQARINVKITNVHC